MKKIIKSLEKLINDIEGKLVCIGLNDEYLIDKIQKNLKISYCDLLNSNTFSIKKVEKKKKQKNLSIKDFRKYFKKKKVNYIICNIKDMEKYLPRFIPDSIYISNTSIYMYGDKDIYDLETLQKRYKRYNVQIEVIESEKEYLLKINTKEAKNKIFKDKLYFIIDNIQIFIDKIGDLIVS